MQIIGAFDRSRVSELEPRPNSILISITSKNSEHPKINKNWAHILRLKFDDVDNKSDNGITYKDAQAILNFVISHIGSDLFINCDAGISRSTGILVALELIFNSRDMSSEYRYHNRYVKNMIRDVWFSTIWNGGRNER